VCLWTTKRCRGNPHADDGGFNLKKENALSEQIAVQSDQRAL